MNRVVHRVYLLFFLLSACLPAKLDLNKQIITTAIPATPVSPPTLQPIAPAGIKQPQFFIVQAGTPLGMPNYIHPEAACNYLGVAGQVFDGAGAPVSDLIISIDGSLSGNVIHKSALTGSQAALGPGGYEIILADSAVDSNKALWLQVHDNQSNPLSNSFYFDTFSSCTKNLLLINLVQKSLGNDSFLPIINAKH